MWKKAPFEDIGEIASTTKIAPARPPRTNRPETGSDSTKIDNQVELIQRPQESIQLRVKKITDDLEKKRRTVDLGKHSAVDLSTSPPSFPPPPADMTQGEIKASSRDSPIPKTSTAHSSAGDLKTLDSDSVPRRALSNVEKDKIRHSWSPNAAKAVRKVSSPTRNRTGSINKNEPPVATTKQIIAQQKKMKRVQPPTLRGKLPTSENIQVSMDKCSGYLNLIRDNTAERLFCALVEDSIVCFERKESMENPILKISIVGARSTNGTKGDSTFLISKGNETYEFEAESQLVAFQWLVAVRGHNIYTRYETARLNTFSKQKERNIPSIESIFGSGVTQSPEQNETSGQSPGESEQLEIAEPVDLMVEGGEDEDSIGRFEKCGRVLHYVKKKLGSAWKPRILEIRDGTLTVYDMSNKNAGKPLLVENVLFCRARVVMPQSKMKYLFELVAPSETNLFSVDSGSELLEWFTVIQELQAYVMNMTIGYDVKGKQDPSAVKDHALIKIMQIPGNSVCADCGSNQEMLWASINLGIFLCIHCAGVHRSLGVDITQVRSLTMDQWKQETIEVMARIGNINANKYWLYITPPNPIAENTESDQRSSFINDKYRLRRYANPAGCPP